MKKLFTILLFALAAKSMLAQNFTAGNIVVSRLGNGTNATTSGAMPVTLVELNPSTGVVTNSVTVPYTTAGQRLVINANSAVGANEGGISLSADGRYIVVGGSDVAQFTANTGSANKSFARVNLAGTVEMFTINSNLATGYIRSTASLDGSAIYSTGAYGLAYAVWGNTTNTTFRFSNTGSSYIHIIGTKLYSASSTNPSTILYFGNAPTSTTTNNGTALTGTSSSTVASDYGFVMLDMDNAISNANDGNDVLYMVDQTVASPGIIKMAYNTTTSNWDYVGKYNTVNPIYGLTGRIVSGKVELYTVNNYGDNNSVISIVDANSRTTFAEASITTTTLASAGTNYVFRSVAFSPYESTLPLNLTSFQASSSGNNATLKWMTNNEVNIKEFVVEKSRDGSNFSIVKVLSAKNQSSNIYNLTDWNIESGTIYYRLKMIDNDGTITFSNIETVTSKGSAVLNIYPNPATDNINVSFPEVRKDALLQIFTLSGKKVREFNLKPSSSQFNLNIADYPSGQYILTIVDGNQQYSSSFIK